MSGCRRRRAGDGQGPAWGGVEVFLLLWSHGVARILLKVRGCAGIEGPELRELAGGF